ncbi:MAG: hypothetical protein JWM95_80 [Gemmatimonadetes bacterium]|nr:hypothetical protein [Gemmatimonadota bacterium]
MKARRTRSGKCMRPPRVNAGIIETGKSQRHIGTRRECIKFEVGPLSEGIDARDHPLEHSEFADTRRRHCRTAERRQLTPLWQLSRERADKRAKRNSRLAEIQGRLRDIQQRFGRLCLISHDGFICSPCMHHRLVKHPGPCRDDHQALMRQTDHIQCACTRSIFQSGSRMMFQSWQIAPMPQQIAKSYLRPRPELVVVMLHPHILHDGIQCLGGLRISRLSCGASALRNHSTKFPSACIMAELTIAQNEKGIGKPQGTGIFCELRDITKRRQHGGT